MYVKQTWVENYVWNGIRITEWASHQAAIRIIHNCLDLLVAHRRIHSTRQALRLRDRSSTCYKNNGCVGYWRISGQAERQTCPTGERLLQCDVPAEDYVEGKGKRSTCIRTNSIDTTVWPTGEQLCKWTLPGIYSYEWQYQGVQLPQSYVNYNTDRHQCINMDISTPSVLDNWRKMKHSDYKLNTRSISTSSTLVAEILNSYV